MPLYRKIDKQNIKPQLRFKEFTKNWKWSKGDDFFESISNKNHDSDLPVLAITQDHGAIPREMIDFNISVSNQSIASYKIVEPGDFIISLRSFQGGIELSNYKGICSPAYIILKAKKKIDTDFFKYYLKTTNYIKNLVQNLEGIRDGKMISYKYFSEIGVVATQLPEQRKIAAFLSVIDKRIQALEKKKNLIIEYKEGVTQKIFQQTKRFNDSNGNKFPEWQLKKLGDLTEKVSKKNKENKKYPIYSINNQEGFRPQADQFEGLNSNDRGYDISMYKIVNEQTFAYNPARINVGSIGYSYELKKVIISSLYVCFKTSKELEDLYLLAYLDTNRFKTDVKRYQEGGVRQYLFYDNFSQIKIPLPSNEEQIKIANFLASLDRKISLISEKIEKTKTYKKGLLQKMFV
jgi:type I restriction enzyme S subunit